MLHLFFLMDCGIQKEPRKSSHKAAAAAFTLHTPPQHTTVRKSKYE
jgi:hypothetical protein